MAPKLTDAQKLDGISRILAADQPGVTNSMRLDAIVAIASKGGLRAKVSLIPDAGLREKVEAAFAEFDACMADESRRMAIVTLAMSAFASLTAGMGQ